MQTWKTRFRRIAAMVCALALCASLLPAGALANNTDGIDVDASSSSQVVTGTEPTEEEKTEETGTETEQPAAETEQPAEETETEEKVEEETEEPAEEPEEEPVEEPEEEPAETVGDGTGEEEDNQPAVNSVILQADNSEPSVEARVADGTETVYTDDDKGISVTAEVGYTGALTRRSVEFIITIDGAEAGRKTIDNFDVWGQNVTIIAPGYQVATRIEGSELVTGTFTHTSGDIYRLIPTANNLTAYIELTSFKTSDTVQIGDYGTFSWEKGDAENDDFERQLTIYVDGEERETFTVYTPDLLTNAGPNDQFWFTPDTDTYNSDVRFQVGGDGTGLTLGSTLGLIDFSVYLTTKCPCGNAWCECPGGSECTCEPGCDCELCNPEQGATEIRTNYGVIEYKEPSGEGYNLTVEVYVNGQLKETTDRLRVRAGESDCLNFTPADGYYYFNDQNSYDLVTDGSSTWDQRTGYLFIVGGRDDNNILKIYLWTFKNHARLDVERRLGDVMDNVTGYMISYEAYNPETKQNETFTYEATSFLLAQSQMVPTDTNVTLTPICDAPYEVSQWSTAGAYTAVTLTGSEGQSQTEAYGNQATINIHNTAFTSVTVYIDSLRGVTPPTEDDLTGNKDNIFDNGVAVIVDCVNDEASHEDANYGLTAGSFEISELKGDSVSGYYVEVTVDPASYVDNYNDIYPDDTHDRTDEDKKVIRLNWEVVTNQDGSYTSAWKAAEPATIKVTCGEVVNEPTKPTSVEIDTLLDVMVTCQNNPNHNKTFTELPTDSYEISAPALNKDTYECTVTITADSYIGQMAGDHKIVDGTPDSKKVLLAYVNDQWIVANEEEATVSFLAECVAPEAPDNITVAGLLKDVTVTCDEHNSKTYDIDDTTITVDKSSLGYDGNNEAFIVKVSVAAQNYVDQYIGDFGPHTLNDNESKTVTLLYQNGSWVLANKDAKVEFKVKCDTPDKPEYDEIAGLLGDVTVTCDVHGTKTYKLSDGNYEVGGIQGGGYGALVKVTVFGAAYVDKFEADHNNIAHKLVGSEQITISLVYQKDGWMIDSSDLGKTIAFQVTCKPDAPTTDEVDALKIKDAVTLDCINTSVNHADVTYDLKSGSYTIGEVVNGGNDLYYVSLTVRPDAYVRDYDKATGSTHTWPGNDYGIINLYWNNDTQAWETRGDYGVKFLVKCSTVTVPGDGGNNNDTPKDEHPDIAEGIANGTWGGTPTPTPAASATSTIPQTSDSMPIGLLAGTAAIAAAAIALLLVLRKRRQQ